MTIYKKVLETGKYFFIFHNSESVSIVDKAHFSGDVESFSGFIKTKTQYKKIKYKKWDLAKMPSSISFYRYNSSSHPVI